MSLAQIPPLLTAARDAQRAGRTADAAARYHAVLAIQPDHAVALNALGVIALAESRAADAAGLLARATAADPAAPELRMNLAKAHRLLGDDAAERAALEQALAADQRHFMALVRLAELHERRGEQAQATERWNGVLGVAAMIEQRAPDLERLFGHARDYVAATNRSFAEAVETSLAPRRQQIASADRRRFDACLDHSFGRRQIYSNHCAGTHFPFLPADEFFDIALFPWLGGIEAETAAIRAELEVLIGAGGEGITPYVAMEPGTPESKWTALDGSLAWGAMHLWKDGRRIDEACARAPHTAAALERLPLADMPGRTPTAFFSLLRPRARIPAHTGVSNTRAIIHLPLIVPDGCGFRVGGETRAWIEGQALAFDDTIEHEAWNDSDDLRAVLIFDVWNPHLTELERDLLRDFFRAADASGHNPRVQASD